jgi:hypothetical protein
MCDFSGRLIAWMDHELPVDEARDVERHVQACADCRSSLASYRQVTAAFEAYCDGAMALRGHRLPRWAVVLSGAVAAAAVLLLAWPRAPVEQPPAVHRQTEAPPPASVLEPAPAAIKRMHRPHAGVPVPSQDANWVPSGPAIQIAIPAEAMFPPGAVPEGINFFADVSIAADGSAERLRLRPRLVALERRPPQP